MKTIALIILAGIIVFLVIGKIKKTPPSRRTSFESILASILRGNTVEPLKEIRTPKISKTEAILKCKDAIRDLRESYQGQLREMISNRNQLEYMIPRLEESVKSFEKKAKHFKSEFEKETEPESKELLRHSSLLYLGLCYKILERIRKTTEYLRVSKIAISTAQIEFETRKSILDNAILELESMTGEVDSVKFQSSMQAIESLKENVVGLLKEKNLEIEASKVLGKFTIKDPLKGLLTVSADQLDKL